MVLAVTGERMRSVLRPHDVVGRYGGEEFLIVLPGCDATAAAVVADRARQSVCDMPTMVNGKLVRVTISAGIATSRSGAESAAELIAGADPALYGAKAAGRNRIELCTTHR